MHRSPLPSLAGICAALLAEAASADEALARKYACTACHHAERKLVGPAWRDIAARHAAGNVGPAQAAAVIKAGSSGRWGALPMPPQNQVPDADLLALAGWIAQAGRR